MLSPARLRLLWALPAVAMIAVALTWPASQAPAQVTAPDTAPPATAPPAPPPPLSDAEDGPCLGRSARQLLCPDLVMRRPSDFKLDGHTRPRRILLRAKNSLDSVGRGPVEIRGFRTDRFGMRVHQRIYRRSGSRLSIPTKGRLRFHFIPGQGRYWKYSDAARFELFELRGDGSRGRLVKRGPKVNYCLRDLKRTRGRLPRSPRKEVYPACSEDTDERQVTLGTSVGWSDVYPAKYHEQWIDVTGLRGCFLYRMTADPKNTIIESNEDNNVAQRSVRLPARGGKLSGCG